MILWKVAIVSSLGIENGQDVNAEEISSEKLFTSTDNACPYSGLQS